MSEFQKIVSTKDAAAFEECALDEAAAKTVFKTAQVHYHNTVRDVLEARKKLWDHIYEAYDLDNGKQYRGAYDREQRRFIITEEDTENV